MDAKILSTGMVRIQSGLAAVAVAAFYLATVAGCGGSAKPVTTRAASASEALVPPRTVEARRLGPSSHEYLRTGARVSDRFGGIRAFANARDGFAIGAPPRLSAETYPLATFDGGNTWRVAGPVLWIAAAQAAVAVGQVGMISPRIWYACCGLNTVVDVTPDAGKHWWQAFLPGEVLAVWSGPQPKCGRLIAVVQPFTKRANPPLWTYASAQGRRWIYAANPNGKLAC